jgi:hypothetical protein
VRADSDIPVAIDRGLASHNSILRKPTSRLEAEV